MIKNKPLLFFSILLSITFVITSINVIQFFLERASFQYSDWLINYQIGFIRRGFIGEIFYHLSKITNIGLDVLLLFFVLSLYLLFYINFFKIIKKIKFKIIDYFIILSPLSFFYTVFEQKVSGRKEIIFFCLLSFFILIIKKISQRNQVNVMMLFTTITSLTHSGLIFYNIYFLLLFFCYNYNNNFKQIIYLVLPFIISSILVLLLISFNSTISEEELRLLCSSIIDYLPNCGKGDYIQTLSWGLKYNFEGNKLLWFDKSFFIFYFFAFIFTFCSFFYVSKKTTFFNFNFLYIIIICLLPTLPLYFIGADYGRYLHISYISSIIIYYFLLSEKIIKRNILFLSFRKIIFIPLLFLYSFTWTVPHCCESEPKFNYRKIIE